MAVAHAPDAPASMLALVLQLAGVDCLHTLGAGVAGPAIAVEVVAVAGVPDLVCFGEGHRSVSVVDLISIEAAQCPSESSCATFSAVTRSRVWAVCRIAPAVWENISRMPAIRARRRVFAMGGVLLWFSVAWEGAGAPWWVTDRRATWCRRMPSSRHR